MMEKSTYGNSLINIEQAQQIYDGFKHHVFDGWRAMGNNRAISVIGCFSLINFDSMDDPYTIGLFSNGKQYGVNKIVFDEYGDGKGTLTFDVTRIGSDGATDDLTLCYPVGEVF